MALVPIVNRFALAMFTAPLLVLVTVLSKVTTPAVMFREAVAGMLVLPPPVMTPPLHVKTPSGSIVRSPVPESVPPEANLRFSAVIASGPVAAESSVKTPAFSHVTPAPVIVVPRLAV
ncbi:MAG: hypothetical protein IH921_15230 [Gemmatimonadetes bacterium]|nr:hypothetical protein [Gemmatimonadota bacterium]